MPAVQTFDTVILGAGAAGMMCAARAAARGGRVLLIDHARSPGEKIRISGGGRCNFTNLHCGPGNFLSDNPHFAKSALARYSQWDFIDLLARHHIAWHEKTLGQLFCDGSARQIVAMLREEMERAGARLWLQTEMADLAHDLDGFALRLRREGREEAVRTRRLVVATGGKSIPKMGASGLGYRIAEQFGLPLVTPRPALVPLTFSDATLPRLRALSGLSVDARVSGGGTSFREGLLFTHRGLSGPSVLQISSFWREGEEIAVDLLPAGAVGTALGRARAESGRQNLTNALAEHLPRRLAEDAVERAGLDGNLADQSNAALEKLARAIHDWRLVPAGTEGYRTAEVTAGGVATGALSSKDMQSRALPGLYFIGEVVDVTGWLGGYNFQWAWSSAVAAGDAIAAA